MHKFYLLFAFCLIFSGTAYGQMAVNGDTLYGSEWIRGNADYYRISITEDGLYRISTQQLKDAGIPTDQISASDYKIFHLGREIPLHLSTDQLLKTGDFIEFRGKKNKNELDRFLFQNGESDQLNPYYSFFTDTAAYYLSWNQNEAGKRYQSFNYGTVDNGLPARNWFYQTVRKSFHQRYIKSSTRINSVNVTKSRFIHGEGYASDYRKNHTFEYELPGFRPALDSLPISVNLYSSYGEHLLQIKANDSLVFEDPVNSAAFRSIDFKIPVSLIEESLKLEIEGVSGTGDSYALGYVTFQYPREFSSVAATEQSMALPARDSSLLRWDSLEGTGNYLLYRPEVNRRIQMGTQNGMPVAPIGAHDEREAVEMYQEGDIRTVSGLNQVELNTYEEYTDRDFIILTSRRFMNEHIQEYADYRASEEGGNYRPLIVFVEDLYESFAYGIRRHNIAARNFMHFLDEHLETDPYVFVVGKGREHDVLRTPQQLEKAIEKGFYVPTFGSPGSDNLMASTNTTAVPIFPLGRLAVSEKEKVKIYLDKIKSMENYTYDGSVGNSNWLREVIHLNGGTFEAEEIAKYFDRMVDTLNTSAWNPEVSSIVRTSNEPVQTEDMEEIFAKINQGANLVNFFGHSTATTLSIDINRPNAYKNSDRLPFLLTLGCNSGNLNIEGESLGETYVLYKDKGFIGSWASGHYGILQVLGVLSGVFYKNYATDYRGAPVGKIIKESLSDIQDEFPRHAAQMMLMCDPAYAIPIPSGTDLTIDPATVKTEPGAIPTTRDSFTIHFSVKNLGLQTPGESHLRLYREFPDGSRDTLPEISFEVPERKRVFEVRLPTGGLEASGVNRIYMEVDSRDSIQERPTPAAEENNTFKTADSTAGFSFIIEDERIQPLLPPPFSIVPDDTVTLVVSGSRHTPDESSVLLQIDTTEQFNSPALRTMEKKQRGNTFRFPVSVNADEVYYWRSSGQYSPTDTTWGDQLYSFIHLPGKEGWNQSHRGQFAQDSFSGLQVHPDRGFFWLDTTRTSYNLKNQHYQSDDEWMYITHDYGHVRQSSFWMGGFSGAYVIVIDPITTLLGMKNPPGGAFGSHNPGGQKRSFAYYTDDSTSRRDLMTFIEDTIPDSMFVIFALNPFELSDTFGIDDWQADSLQYDGKNLFNFFEKYGAEEIRKLKDHGPVPYTFMFRKGDRAYAEGIAESQDETIVTEGLFRVLRDSGSVRSPWYGPVEQADSLSWSLDSSFWNAEHSQSIKLMGSHQRGGDGTPLQKVNFEPGDRSISIDSTDFNYFALEYSAEDPINKSIAPLRYWRMFYSSPVPELTFDPETHYEGPADTVPQGYRETFEVAIRNVGATMQDSFELSYRLVNDRNEWITASVRTMPPLRSSEYSVFQFDIDPGGATGPFQILVQINPDKTIAERQYENNIFQENFYISPDRKRPRLEVLFDGRHLTDYEPIRSKPVIEVRLEDANPAAPIDDSSAIEWTIEQPSGTLFPLSPTDSEVSFSAATDAMDTATWTVQPNFEEFGVYTFRVNGTDKAGNEAGATDYSIHFKIQEKQRISYLTPSPNPLSNYSRFKYALEGGDQLGEYRIEIFNVHGQKVRTLTENDLGTLFPGERYTEGYWKGTDQQGSPLDTGIYFYKLFPESHDPEHLPTSADSFFEDGWGRMTIIR